MALDAALEAPERVAGLVLLAPAISGDPGPDEEAFNAATDGLAGAIDAAWTAGEREECNRLEVRLWLDGPAGPEGRVSGPPRELALDMNRIVIANGEPDADGASGLDAASRVHEIAIPSLPGRAHLPYLEAPEEIAALIIAEAV